MKRNYLRLSGAACHAALIAILTCALWSINSAAISAQSIDAVSLPITTDAMTGSWKPTVDFSAVLVAERIDAAQVLAGPNLKVDKAALYTGYDRMLAYMQTDLTAIVPLEDLVDINYKKVVLETPNDPALKNMDPAEFSALRDALVSKLKIQ
jgi:hypothetical protein